MSYTNENFYYEVVLDVETSGLDYKVNELIGVGIYCPSKDIDVYVPAVQYTGDDVYERDELRKEKLINYIHKTFFADPYAVVIFHNAKFDLKFLKVSSFSQLLCRVIDTAILYHIIYPNQEKNLDSVAKHLLNITSKEQYNNSVPARIKNKKWLWPVTILADYCKNDCKLTYIIYQKLLDEIINNNLLDFAKEQHRYLAALYEIEIAGIRIDQDKLAEEIESITSLLSSKEEELQVLIRSYCPELLDLNYKSSKQLSSLLYEKLGLEKVERETYPSGKVFDKLFTSTMTNKNLLKKLDHEIPLFVTEVKKLETVLKYYKNYISLSHAGIIHPQFNLTGTVTGRLSCSKPNLQNIGKTIDVFGHEYRPRSSFVASPGYNLVSMDYKQQEIRMLAVLSQDAAYLDAMSKGVDMHEAISYAMFPSLSPDERKQKRTLIKNLHFGLLYGLGTASLAYQLELSQEETRMIVNNYYDNFNGVRGWMNRVKEQVLIDGYVHLFSGRKWVLDVPSHAYKVINAIIQGSSADLTAKAVIDLSDYFKSTKHGRIVSIIHDEILMEIEEGLIACIGEVKEIMEQKNLFGLPFLVDIEIGKSYGDFK